MGNFRVQVEIGNAAGGGFEILDALVDTGATYTWVPGEVLERLGIRPEEEWPFELADGRQMMYGVAWIRIRLNGRSQPTIAVFGNPGSEPLLGVFTLEGFRLAADPVNRCLMPVPGLLKESHRSPPASSASLDLRI